MYRLLICLKLFSTEMQKKQIHLEILHLKDELLFGHLQKAKLNLNIIFYSRLNQNLHC